MPKSVKEYLNDPNGNSIADIFEETIDKNMNRTAFIYIGCKNYPESELTFSDLELSSNKVANFFLEKNYKPKCVALYMQNCVEYVILWLGLCKAGIEIAFLNNGIKTDSLLHSIKVSKAEYVLYGKELEKQIEEIHLKIPKLSVSSGLLEITCLNETRPKKNVRSQIKFTDVFGYVFTSGTTGLPKAVKMTHLKQFNFSRGYSSFGISNKTVLYSSGMPLYHSSAGSIGTGLVLQFGSCQVLRNKFSASHWLLDILKYNVTAFQYIGEICRYILNYTKQNKETMRLLKENKQKLKIMFACGNGLSSEIWAEFQIMFNVNKILEFYGSTEGNGSFTNLIELKNLKNNDFSGIGCIGKVNERNKNRFRIIKYDIEKDKVILNIKGEVVDCKVNEPGECLFPILNNLESTKFVGYTDKNSTNKKVLVDKNKPYFRTGDLLSVDEKGWIRFIDRIGDTFRWKGENVSTAEVASELVKSNLIQEVNVYGVKIPFLEGRAGCAALVLSPKGLNNSLESFNDKFLKHAQDCLPSYSVPIFIRILKETQLTGVSFWFSFLHVFFRQ